MDPTTCQALCAVIVQNGDQVGVLLAELALGLYAAVTTALAFVGRIKLRRANERAELEAKRAEAAERERVAAATERDAVAVDRDYWREQSMRPFPRPPLLPGELVPPTILEDLSGPRCELAGANTGGRFMCTREAGHSGSCAPVPVVPSGLEGDGNDGTRYAELPERPADRPVQFDETPTDPGKRKPG